MRERESMGECVSEIGKRERERERDRSSTPKLEKVLCGPSSQSATIELNKKCRFFIQDRAADQPVRLKKLFPKKLLDYQVKPFRIISSDVAETNKKTTTMQ